MVGPCQVNTSRTRPMYVRNHSFVQRAASAEQFDITHAIIIRHDMTFALSCTQGHVARPVLVDDKHGGAAHARAGAEGDPLVVCGSFEAKVEIVGGRRGCRGWNCPAVADFL